MDRGTPPWLKNWLERHQHPGSRGLHYVGIPLAVAAVLVAIAQLVRGGLDWTPLVLLVAGYVLQYIGHRIEGNDMGEVVLVKKLMGRPYCAVAPRYRPSAPAAEPVASPPSAAASTAGRVREP